MTQMSTAPVIPLWARDSARSLTASSRLLGAACHGAGSEKGKGYEFVIAFFQEGEPNADYSNISLKGCETRPEVDGFLRDHKLQEGFGAFVLQKPDPTVIHMA